MVTNKVKINGVSINLDTLADKSQEDIKAMELFADNADASHDALFKELDALKAKPPVEEKIEVVKPVKKRSATV
jgi:hypothetical protein